MNHRSYFVEIINLARLASENIYIKTKIAFVQNPTCFLYNIAFFTISDPIYY